ncbi:MAG: murein biosynthesis integral membrane protein MurJ [Desulfobacterales bacterium CG07_land_8_20_14_0_80_52_14]|nr:MAG: murein biosynthesis integral membrane protein MurJ [Desulfobacterales bacterium CG23_combo_of_CG06-09_8_20_14_all_52_9]PIU49284.1 MAG: murein biosynthesis integral membrane protein MurJ [Desulfobacterales bacterium CG07_land_8_20_14_0_80_52_14]
MDESRHVFRAAGVVGSATLLSRIFGFVRDAVIAGFFGAGAGADAFFVAFRIPNLLRRLLAEGSLSISFIPVFTGYLSYKGRDEAYCLARSAFRLLVLVLVTVSVLGVLLSPIIVKVIAPGFARFPEKMALTVTLTRIMFPYIFFVGLMALFMGILNALGHFAAPALAPVMLNLMIIGAVFFISPVMSEPVLGLAIGVLLGGALQAALQVPAILKKGIRLAQKTPLWHPGLKKVLCLMLPTVLGAAVYQINVLVSTLLASLLPEGSVSYLYYADRLVQFPLGIFATATATALLPSLSRLAASGDLDSVRKTFSDALRLVVFISLPAMTGLIVLREPLIALLFERGAFSPESTRLTAVALLYYSIGLWAFSAVRVVVSTFYAFQDTKTPVWTAAVSVVSNIGFGIVLMGRMGHGGLALAASLASMVNLGLLLWMLKVRMISIGAKKILPSLLRSAAGSLAMGAGLWLIAFKGIPERFWHDSGLPLSLAACLLLGIGFYGAFSLMTGSPELKHFASFFKKGAVQNDE